MRFEDFNTIEDAMRFVEKSVERGLISTAAGVMFIREYRARYGESREAQPLMTTDLHSGASARTVRRTEPSTGVRRVPRPVETRAPAPPPKPTPERIAEAKAAVRAAGHDGHSMPARMFRLCETDPDLAIQLVTGESRQPKMLWERIAAREAMTVNEQCDARSELRQRRLERHRRDLGVPVTGPTTFAEMVHDKEARERAQADLDGPEAA